ncbi:NADH:flavin oxidoreductase [Salinibacterium sp. NG253]|uniref:NADH:flavin oxidoreductase n=1 Tax=Salinibacterium sp. NG253 TaxID=2792039 RepID=UPI0018CCFF12|nr:NADH:flavin oxidoreductase [Salinibacterium sp. NG253]MBH0116793.1 NADH:flavin oxidoreductase [Salinibacterium sp. NG253]
MIDNSHTIHSPVWLASGIRSANRVALAPMTNRSSNADGTLSASERSWLLRRARGGFGIVISCGVYVSLEGQSWPGQLGLTTQAHADSLRPMAAELRAAGSLGIVQLFHGGLRANPDASGVAALAPSANSDDAWSEATEADIARIIAAYRASAALAAAAGFAGVEVHGAHGYLPAQFLSATENARTDQWGGSIENRARLLCEIVRAVRDDHHENFAIGVRLSSEDARQSRGIDIDESVAVAKMMVEAGADFIHLSVWDCDLNSAKHPEIHPITLFRDALPANVPLMVAGKIWTGAEAQRALARGADIVALGRAGILNPDWPERALSEDWAPERGPLTEDEFAEISVGNAFVSYLREKWPQLVK